MKVFIQARMSSSRLPGKVLTNISNDENTLDLIIGKLNPPINAKYAKV